MTDVSPVPFNALPEEWAFDDTKGPFFRELLDSIDQTRERTGGSTDIIINNDTNITIEVNSLRYDSIAAASLVDHSDRESIVTISYFQSTSDPKGGGTYYKDGTTGTASTIYADRMGFYDSQGAGFSLLADTIHISQLGAVGDGTTDDTLAFTHAIKSNRTIKLADNETYLIDGVEVTSLTDFTMIGGVDSVVKLSANADDEVFKFTSCTNIKFKDVSIDGNRLNQTTQSGSSARNALFFQSCDGCHVNGGNHINSAASAIRMRDSDNCIIENITGSESGYIPLYIGPAGTGGSQVDYVRVSNNRYDWSSVDVEISRRALLAVSSTDSATSIRRILINGNDFIQSNDALIDSFHSCINVRTGKHIRVIDNYCRYAGLPITIVADCENLACIGNSVETETSDYGIEIAGGMEKWAVVGNTVEGNDTADTGIQINGASSYGTVSSNTIHGVVGVGIRVSSTSYAAPSRNVTIAGNDIEINGGPPYSLKWLNNFSLTGGTVNCNGDGTAVVVLDESRNGSIVGLHVRDPEFYFVRLNGATDTLENIIVTGNSFESALASEDRYIFDATTGSTVTNVRYIGNSHGSDEVNGIVRSDITELNIASGVVTVTGGFHKIDTESAAATDDLDTINGGQDGQILVLRDAFSSRDVTYKHGTGNLVLAGGADFTATTTTNTLTLIYDGDSSQWLELSRQ